MLNVREKWAVAWRAIRIHVAGIDVDHHDAIAAAKACGWTDIRQANRHTPHFTPMSWINHPDRVPGRLGFHLEQRQRECVWNRAHPGTPLP